MHSFNCNFLFISTIHSHISKMHVWPIAQLWLYSLQDHRVTDLQGRLINQLGSSGDGLNLGQTTSAMDGGSFPGAFRRHNFYNTTPAPEYQPPYFPPPYSVPPQPQSYDYPHHHTHRGAFIDTNGPHPHQGTPTSFYPVSSSQQHQYVDRQHYLRGHEVGGLGLHHGGFTGGAYDPRRVEYNSVVSGLQSMPSVLLSSQNLQSLNRTSPPPVLEMSHHPSSIGHNGLGQRGGHDEHIHSINSDEQVYVSQFYTI